MNYFERFMGRMVPGGYRRACQRLGVNCRLFPALGFWIDWSKPLFLRFEAHVGPKSSGFTNERRAPARYSSDGE
jgi:hypothetical protein